MPTEKQLENLKKGKKTRFNGENAAEMAKRSVASRKKKAREREEARKELEAFQEIARSVMNLALYEGKAVDIDDIKSITETEGKNLPVKYGIVLAQAIKALKGDRGAAEFMRDTAGEKPVDRQDISLQTIDKSVEAMEAYFNDKRRST